MRGLLIIATLVAISTPALARGDDFVAGALGGFIAGSIFAAPRYVEPAPPPPPAPVCRWREESHWSERRHAWVVRRFRECE